MGYEARTTSSRLLVQAETVAATSQLLLELLDASFERHPTRLGVGEQVFELLDTLVARRSFLRSWWAAYE